MVLPVPNHVVLNHLYTLSIRDGVMALGTTSRYRKKVNNNNNNNNSNIYIYLKKISNWNIYYHKAKKKKKKNSYTNVYNIYYTFLN